MRRRGIAVYRWLPVLLVAAGLAAGLRGEELIDRPSSTTTPPDRASLQQFVKQFCFDCHNSKDKTAGLVLDSLSTADVAAHPKEWEKVVRRLAARQMPPTDVPRPSEKAYDTTLATLETSLDTAAAAHPNPGRTPSIRRLNRTEYQNAIRDLLALDINAATLLPNDESSHGFDNLLTADLSPTLVERYITSAQKISRLAVGSPLKAPNVDTFRIRADVTQEEQSESLPIGTRGGTSIAYHFPQDGQYEIQVWLARDRNEHIEGLDQPAELEVLVDRERKDLLTITPPADHEGRQTVDDKLKTRIQATAGEHQLGVTFIKEPSSLLETKRQPYQAHYNMHRHPRITPAIFQVSITGPYDSQGRNNSASRRAIFNCEPISADDEEGCAKRILTALVRRAYRRPLTDADLEVPLKFYRAGRADGDFDAGIERALSAVLVNPQFLFRVEHNPAGAEPNSPYRISDLELASRLSFFLWSSIPDDELLALAEHNELSKPEIYEQQVRRLLADTRSRNLTTNFANQWLYLRNLDSITPDLRLFPDFDDNLRQAFREETELFFDSILREDRSVLDLLHADYTFLDERLAKHYGIPNVYGSRFRRVSLESDGVRGGLLRQGSILTVTSYATRTSPVIRGKWILENLLGSPPPRPPSNVPSLKDNTVSENLSVRERLSEHRANAACATCHKQIDPVGFGLEEFDAIGRWRTTEEGKPIDAHGGLPDGSEFTGVAGLEQALLARPELFVRTVTEKLLTFALGREVESFDAPAIRKIIRDAKAQNYRLSSLIMGVATSTPFTMRSSE